MLPMSFYAIPEYVAVLMYIVGVKRIQNKLQTGTDIYLFHCENSELRRVFTYELAGLVTDIKDF
jgi:hypothetical protein